MQQDIKPIVRNMHGLLCSFLQYQRRNMRDLIRYLVTDLSLRVKVNLRRSMVHNGGYQYQEQTGDILKDLGVMCLKVIEIITQ